MEMGISLSLWSSSPHSLQSTKVNTCSQHMRQRYFTILTISVPSTSTCSCRVLQQQGCSQHSSQSNGYSFLPWMQITNYSIVIAFQVNRISAFKLFFVSKSPHSQPFGLVIHCFHKGIIVNMIINFFVCSICVRKTQSIVFPGCLRPFIFCKPKLREIEY